jgi:serine/threonine-protein kinase
MGVVWLADDEKLGRKVALKVLPPERVGDLGARARLLREARVAGSLEHTNIVRVYDVGETADGGAFLVMELVRGKTLAELIHEDGLDLAQRLSIVASVARALAHAHRAGLVHRDVKPENVMRTDDGRVVLLDLGVAKSSAGSGADAAAITATAEGAIVGTPAYLAPEQARGTTLDARADQFALGVTLFETLTRRLPWSSTNVAGVLAEIVADTPLPPSSIDASLPSSLDALVAQAMAKRAEDRFADMDALAEAIDTVREQLGPRPILIARSTDGVASRPARAESLRTTTAAETLPRSAPPRKVGRALALLLPLAAAAVWASWPRPSPLASVGSVVACPPLEATVDGEAAAWLGAAGAALACRQIALRLGGAPSCALGPAALLDRPHTPAQDLHGEPFGSAEDRARALAAAERADAWIDGTVAYSDRAFDVTLVVRSASGDEIAGASGHDAYLPRAVRHALDAMDRETFPSRPLDAHAASTLGTHDPSAAMSLELLFELELAGSSIGDVECDELATAPLTDDARATITDACAQSRSQVSPPLRPIALDETDSFSLARSATAMAHYGAAVDRAALRSTLEARRRTEPDALARAHLALAEGEVAAATGADPRPLALAAISIDPTLSEAWLLVADASFGGRDTEAIERARTEWLPESPDAWNNLGVARGLTDIDASITLYRRAIVLGGDAPVWSTNLSGAMLLRGDRVGARAVASALALYGSGLGRLGAATIESQVDSSEGDFASALDRIRTELEHWEVLGMGTQAGNALLLSAVLPTHALGRDAEFVGWLVARYLEPDPPHLDPRGGVFASSAIAMLCARAAEPALVARCFARLAAIGASGFFVGDYSNAQRTITAAERFAAGDYAAAARLLRAVTAPRTARDLGIEAALLANEDDAVERARAVFDAAPGRVTWLNVEAARSAERHGDHARAVALARAIVAAWSGADAEIPVLTEMRALAAAP